QPAYRPVGMPYAILAKRFITGISRIECTGDVGFGFNSVLKRNGIGPGLVSHRSAGRNAEQRPASGVPVHFFGALTNLPAPNAKLGSIQSEAEPRFAFAQR